MIYSVVETVFAIGLFSFLLGISCMAATLLLIILAEVVL